jgi:hypothetical protein
VRVAVTSPSERFGPRTRSVTYGVRLWAKGTTCIARGVTAFLKWANQSPVGFFRINATWPKGGAHYASGIFLERGSPISHTYCGSDERHSLHGGEWLHFEPCIDHTFSNFNVQANAYHSVGSRLCNTPAFILVHSGLHFSGPTLIYMYTSADVLMHYLL